MLKFPEEQSGLPGTFFAEDKPLIGGFFTKTTNEQYLTEQERLSKEDFRKSASPNLDQSALTKKEMKLKWLRLGQRAASPTFSRKTIRASCDHSKIESKMLLAQKAKIIAEDNKSIREKKDNDYERWKNNYERRKELPPVADESVMRCKS